MLRVIERNGSGVVAMAMMLYGLPRAEENMEGLVVLPGLGEVWRLIQAVQVWETSAMARYFLVAGHNQREKTWTHLTVERLTEQPFNLKRRDSVHVAPHAEHTKEQAEWLVEKIQEDKISSLALFVSPYHLLRAYCTVLRALNKKGVRIPVAPVPVAISPEIIIPETYVNAWEMVQGEVERLIAYQKKGDAATYDELREYLGWLWTQDPYSRLLIKKAD